MVSVVVVGPSFPCVSSIVRNVPLGDCAFTSHGLTIDVQVVYTGTFCIGYLCSSLLSTPWLLELVQHCQGPRANIVRTRHHTRRITTRHIVFFYDLKHKPTLAIAHFIVCKDPITEAELHQELQNQLGSLSGTSQRYQSLA